MATITLGAFALRMISIGNGDLSFDEAASALIARKPLAEMLPYLLSAIHEHPPGYYVLLSGWIQLAGSREVMLRLFSVLPGVLSIPLMYRWAREAVGVRGGILAALLLSLAPVHIWYSQNARMYALVGALALLSWWLLLRLQRAERRREWLALSACELFGLLTHYYMGLVIASQGAYLLLTWRENRRLFGKWLLGLSVPIALGAIYIVASPGALATLGELFARGAGSATLDALHALAADLVFGPHGNLGIGVWSGVLLFVALGIVLALSGRAGVKRSIGAMLACALLVPLLLVLALPEAIAARYVLFLIFPMVLALTISILAPMVLPVRRPLAAMFAALLALAWIGLSISRLPYHYDASKGDYGRLMARLQLQIQPGDGVIFNGPWQSVLQTYYPVGDAPAIYLPPRTPPALDPNETEPQLEEWLGAHRRLWVIPLEVAIADPSRYVATWLDAHAYPALDESDLALYYAPPTSSRPIASAPVRFGDAIELSDARLADAPLWPGEAALVRLTWHTLRPLDGDVQVQLEIVGSDGSVWGRRQYQPGERFVPVTAQNSGAPIVDQQAVPIEIGTPPGAYMLRVTVQRPSSGELLTPQSVSDLSSTGVTLASLQIELAPESIVDERLPGAPIDVRFGDSLSLVAYRLPSMQFVQGGAIPIVLYWRALDGARDVRIEVSLVDDAGRTISYADQSPGPEWYPATQWRTGEIVAMQTGLRIPPRLNPSVYRLQVRLLAPDGRALIGQGAIDRPGVLGLWRTREAVSQSDWPLGAVDIVARERSFAAPPVQHALSITFGDRIKLLGYALDERDARAGGRLRVTFYWQALTRMDIDYFVFTHLRDASGALRGQRDRMPLNGANPTSFWEAGEVVTDTYVINIDPDASPGDYTLDFGWYDFDASVRLAAVGPDGAPYADDVAIVSGLSVK